MRNPRVRFMLVVLACICGPAGLLRAATPHPNVVLIMTDDQGAGDFGVTGNPLIETPHIDAMARRSASMTTFYVSPVCSPTRACLMTGRYNYRTRCIDTWLGRSMMEPDEVTVAEVLREAGYATGIFGKWHLGDCYPMRAIDQGFQEALIHRGGGLAQPSEPRENRRRYTDAILFHNGSPRQTRGYCTDVYFQAALKFMDTARRGGRPFFVYLPTNAPHGPFHDVPPELLRHYQSKAMQKLIVGQTNPRKLEQERDRLARIAAMITNVDQNVGNLFDKLNAWGITENTLVIFLVDNGPNSRRFVGPWRGSKTQVHEGGVRSPLWLHWPDKLRAGLQRDELSAHIDLMPTILDACGVAQPSGLALDGRSLLPLLLGTKADWSDRTIVIQSHRGDQPVRYHNFMIRDKRWKLLHASGFGRTKFSGNPQFELYDLINDPGESRDLAGERRQVLARLQAAYDRWFDDVGSTRPDNYAPPRIHVGSEAENPTVLTRQDWRGGSWAAHAIGYWELLVVKPRKFEVELLFDPGRVDERVTLKLGPVVHRKTISAGDTSCLFSGITLEPGQLRLQAVLEQAQQQRGVYQAIVRFSKTCD